VVVAGVVARRKRLQQQHLETALGLEGEGGGGVRGKGGRRQGGRGEGKWGGGRQGGGERGVRSDEGGVLDINGCVCGVGFVQGLWDGRGAEAAGLQLLYRACC